MTDYALQNYQEARDLWNEGCVGENKKYQDMILLSTRSVLYLEQLKKKNYNIVDKSLSSPFMNVRLQNRLLKQKKLHSF